MSVHHHKCSHHKLPDGMSVALTTEVAVAVMEVVNDVENAIPATLTSTTGAAVEVTTEETVGELR